MHQDGAGPPPHAIGVWRELPVQFVPFFEQDWPAPQMPPLTDPQRLELLRLLDEKPQLNQRELARALGVSLGKANYCVKALIEKGFVKLGNFRKNPHKRQYSYLLTPAGLEEKTRITLAFLRLKLAEYEALEKEIEQLKGDLNSRRARETAISGRSALEE